MKIINHYMKPKTDISQQINYIALALMDLAGNEMPEEVEIQQVERRLNSIVRKTYLQNLMKQ